MKMMEILSEAFTMNPILLRREKVLSWMPLHVKLVACVAETKNKLKRLDVFINEN